MSLYFRQLVSGLWIFGRRNFQELVGFLEDADAQKPFRGVGFVDGSGPSPDEITCGALSLVVNQPALQNERLFDAPMAVQW